MTTPLPVVLHRPNKTGAQMGAMYFSGLAGTLVAAWLVMLILGALHHDALPWLPALSYWHTLLALVGIRLVRGGFASALHFADAVKESK